MAHASRVICRPEGILSHAYGCYRCGAEGQEPLISFLFGPSQLPTAEFGMSAIPRHVGVGRFPLGEKAHSPEELFWKQCHSHYPPPANVPLCPAFQDTWVLSCDLPG